MLLRIIEKRSNKLLLKAIKLWGHQLPAQEATAKKDFGIIVAPPGRKTVVSLAIIKDKQQLAFILVHRKQLADWWVERIESFLGIPQKDIGRIGRGKSKPGKHTTVAMIQAWKKQSNQQNNRNCAVLYNLERPFGRETVLNFPLFLKLVYYSFSTLVYYSFNT